MDNIKLKNKIMRRVYAIWVFRKITEPLIIEGLIFVAIITITLSHIHCFYVIKNAFNSSPSFSALPGFFFNAFVNAGIFEKILSLGMVIMTLILVWELIKRIKKQGIQPLEVI